MRLANLFGDNMVLQMGPRTPVYGKATPREVIRVALGTHTAEAQADDHGDWHVDLDLPRPEGPLDLEIDGPSEKQIFHNVLVGEVWICSGQSNMEWSYHDAKIARQSISVGNANRQQLRLFKVRHNVASSPMHDVQGKWVVCSPNEMNPFSLLGYFFGAGIQARLGYGVGMIESDWGGTPAESWTPRETLSGSDLLRPLIDSKLPVPTGAGKENHRPKPERAASVLYNGMISPLMTFGFRGVIWYQGESNVGRAAQYRALFPAMIGAWRRAAGRTFPFLFVQLADFEPGASDSAKDDWATLRDAQEAALKLPMTGMATAVDLAHASNIHWLQRDELGKRLVWSAMNTAYDQQKPAGGPVYRSMTVSGNEVRLVFDNKLNGLMIRSEDGLSGFEVAGADRVFYPAYARIHDGDVFVSSSKVPNPVAVRYGWADDPDISLYNSAGLPAPPFRTDDWGPLSKERLVLCRWGLNAQPKPIHPFAHSRSMKPNLSRERRNFAALWHARLLAGA